MNLKNSARWILPIAAIACVPALAQSAPMDTSRSAAMDYVDAALRWTHVLFGILWIGHLYYFNFVQGGFEAKLDAATKKIVVPELRPRALFWFRWGAAWTWISGLLLLGLVRYMVKGWSDQPSQGYMMVGVVLLMPFIYHVIAKKLGPFTPAGLGINLALFASTVYMMHCVGKFDGRSIFIHTGALLGTAMALNVWMVIWPAQRKIITAIKAGTPPPPELVAIAGARSRHNTYMSIPLIFMMFSNHYTGIYGGDPTMAIVKLLVIVAIGFGTAKVLYSKAAKVTGF